MASNTYRGIHTSLYGALPVETIKDIERAIWFKMTGRANDARAIFQHELKPFMRLPVVIIEYADLEHEGGRWGTAWRILDAGLADAKESRKDLDAPEYRLIALTRAMLGTRHRGDLASSALEVERTQRWLCNVPITEYTDIQASCIRRYVISYLFTKIYSAYENAEAEHIPISDDDMNVPVSRKPWSGLHELRRSFCGRGMFNEANALFRVELNRTPLDEREPVIEDFLTAVDAVTSDQGGDYIEAIARLQWATTCVMLQNLPRAEEEIAKSETAFNRFCDYFDLQNRENMPHMQALAYEKLTCMQNPLEKLSRAEELASTLERVGGFKTDMCLSDAAELAIAIYRITSEQEYQDKYFDLQSRQEKYDQTVSEDLTDLVMHRNDLISATLSSLVDRQKSLEWIDGFLKQYDYFKSPVVLASLYRSKSGVLKALRRLDEANEADEKANQLEGSWPSVGEWMHFRAIPAAIRLADPASSPEFDPEDEDVGEPFFWHWQHILGDQVKIDEIAVNLLWEWSLDDVATGHLALEEFQRMMNVPDAQIADVDSPERTADIEAIRGKGSTDIASIIFIGNSDIVASQEDRYNRICRWLSEGPRGHHKRRLFCLVMLRDARQYHFCEKKMWDLRIRELYHLLDLEQTLPRPIREMFPHFKGSWLGALAVTHIALLDTVSDFTDTGPLEKLLEAERCNELALNEFRRTKDRASFAIHQRTGAQICMIKILRLQQLSRQEATGTGVVGTDAPENMPAGSDSPSQTDAETVKEVQRLRAVGIEKVNQADEIFTESEIHASWSDGLDGITHRQDITAFHGSAHTVRQAIYLLLAEHGEPSPETVSSVWKWVQKFKARSLARTIGVRSYDPPDLISSIMASPDTRTLYEEMLSLLKRIKDTEPMARFELRRQLDTHMTAMKKDYPLLRQLLDLREATPFELSDIATIEAQAGASVVLVDWFYLPPYVAGEAERILLLTARADSKPTLDFLTTKQESVMAWQREYLFPQKWAKYREENLNISEARNKFEDTLGGLVAPLARRTKPNEVMVLCPSNILHRVPLHALSVRNYPDDPEDSSAEGLMHRNPVVYTHSHSLLRSCFAATEHTRHSPASFNAHFLSGILEDGASDANNKTIDQFKPKEGRDSIQGLARRFNTPPMMDGGASKEKFLRAATESRLLHIQTHCNWKAEDPLDHHVEFPRPRKQEDKGPEDPAMPQVECLTARELFGVRVPSGTHVNLIACQGGVTDVKLGDEVMGLVPALLCSGATSTVSTLWKIEDVDGAMFAEAFFDSFFRQCARRKVKGVPRAAAGRPEANGEASRSSEGSPAGFVNLAKAVQSAIKKMDNGQSQPLYKWAGFVLHGFWQFPVSADDMKWLQARK